MREQLAELGVTCGYEEPRPDITVLHDGAVLAQEKAGSKRDDPIFVYERRDSATVNIHSSRRKLLQRPTVLRWLKETSCRDWRVHNQPHLFGRYHTTLLADIDASGPVSPAIPLSEAEAQKIALFPPIHLDCKFDDARRLKAKPMRKRSIDVTFTGTVDYDLDLISKHRRRACSEISGLNGSCLLGIGRVLQKQVFLSVLQDTRIFVSPYGNGEYSFKDFEAVYAGAVLVKPPISHVVTGAFDIYAPGVSVVEADVWFRGLRDTVGDVLDNLPAYEERAEFARLEIHRSESPERLAREFATMVHDALA